MQELEVETKRHKDGYTSAPKELEVTEETIFEGGTINKLTKSEVEGNTHVRGNRQFVPGTLRRTDFNDHLQVIDVDATDGTAWYAIAERNLNHRIAEWIKVPPLP